MIESPDILVFNERALSLSHSTEFLNSLTAMLRDKLEVDAAWVGELSGQDSDRVRVLSCNVSPVTRPIDDYDACDETCAGVLNRGESVSVPDHATHLYPLDKFFADNDIAGYCAVPLIGATGAPIGILAVCTKTVMHETASYLANLKAVATRTAHEIESSRAEETLKSLSISEASRLSPELVFHDLAKRLSAAFRCSATLITEFRESPAESIRLLSYVEAQREFDSLYGETINRNDTPYETLTNSDHLIIESGLQNQYPDFPAWSNIKLDGYAGSIVQGTDGKALGHLAIASDRPLPRNTLKTPIWSVIATQVAVYIEKLKTDRQRRTLEIVHAVNQNVRNRSVAASVLGHDIGNLLAAISASNELCEIELGDNEKARRHLQTGRLAIQQASSLATKMLHRVDSLGNRKVSTNVAEYLAMMAPSFEAICGNVAHVVTEPIDPDYAIAVDQDELTQVMMNLVDNAIKACKDSFGQVTISATADCRIPPQKLLSGQINASTSYVYLSVTDNGCGIATGRLESILRSFDASNNKHHGIGLLAVREIVRRHSGAIALSSDVGKGTEVTLCWPMCNASDNAPAQRPIDADSKLH